MYLEVMSMELKDKLYTSTQVAEILGVSLRTLYRYMEDGRIGSMRTASGRHRFTKDQILDFLNVDSAESRYDDSKPVQKETPVQESVASPAIDQFKNKAESVTLGYQPDTSVANTTKEPEEKPHVVDLSAYKTKSELGQFPEDAGDSYDDELDLDEDPIVAENPARPGPFDEPFESKIEPETPKTRPSVPVSPVENKKPESTTLSDEFVEKEVSHEKESIASEEESNPISDLNVRYYKSEHSDLIRLAKKIDEVANARDLEYAFSGYAGLSLHFLIKKTFTLLHFYANPEDMQIWKEELSLVPTSKKEDANIAIIVNTDIVFVPTKEMSGFRVVEDKVLLRDLSESQELELARQFRLHLANASA